MMALEILISVVDAQLFEAIPMEVLQPEEIGEKLSVEDVEVLLRHRLTFLSSWSQIMVH